MQNSRRTTVRNGEPAIMSMGGMCARCICDNGIFSSSSCQPRSVTACSSGQRDCMKNGVAIEHGTSKMVSVYIVVVCTKEFCELHHNCNYKT